MSRVSAGDNVRLYGFPGVFEVRQAEKSLYRKDGLVAVREIDGREVDISFIDSSVVEVNGAPVPMLSCPLVHPAEDYPHEPTFEYSDGPQSNADRIVAAWKARSSVATGGVA